MNETEYFKVSKENGLPNRCPIINYCKRRAITIYLFSEHAKYDYGMSMVHALQKDGTIPEDFLEKEVQLQGEQPSIRRGKGNYHFTDMCPEVNLFDHYNALINESACVEGSYDEDRLGEKHKVIKTQHFSRCGEFNKYAFEKGLFKKPKLLLQKEVNSSCPFCTNSDVDHFHVHHIDENPSNNSIENLIMLCPNCHSKITKGDISQKQVELKKSNLSTTQLIECAKVSIVNESGNWLSEGNADLSFIQMEGRSPEFPLLSFSFINHYAKTILLHKIELRVQYVQGGLSGFPVAKALTPTAHYDMKLPQENQSSIFVIKDELVFAAGAAGKAIVRLFSESTDGPTPASNPMILNFEFKFSSNISLKLPPIYLNCPKEEGMNVFGLS